MLPSKSPVVHSLPPLSQMVMISSGQPQMEISAISPPSSGSPSPTSASTQLHKFNANRSTDLAPAMDKCTCKAEGNHIPRPRNAFILFRQKNHQALLEEGSIIKTNPDVSRELGKRWRNLSVEEKSFWNKMAEEEKKKHAEKYPGYKYTPRRAVKKNCPACRARHAIKTHNLNVQNFLAQQQQQQQQQQQEQRIHQQAQHQQQYWNYPVDQQVYQMRSSSSPPTYLNSPQQSANGSSVSSIASSASSASSTGTVSNAYAIKNYTTSLPFPTYSIPPVSAPISPPFSSSNVNGSHLPPPPQVVLAGLPRQHQQQFQQHHQVQGLSLPPISNLSLPPLHVNLQRDVHGSR
ncbi:unnamed protein product [Kuraishia capsulata CBS 1993]|uniref:HMG box domain-containing protein n=1 Tax=Kuraishia capsulata CBS 1993 TaxID=1382522 RepID=W6MJ74_9ASCO|nr:uncharacterized protein KUCA_T00002521001 [Kuraishia capsulata CBS 1993]CDK26549.1 unnamed protein product [Kuraishia capsulata CBS 1993]